MDDIIEKIRVPTKVMNPKKLVDGKFDIKETLVKSFKNGLNGDFMKFEVELEMKDKKFPIVLSGKCRILHDEFSKMPRG